jgi:hypothetical protein
MRFLQVYGRVIGLLGADLRIAALLTGANLLVAALLYRRSPRRSPERQWIYWSFGTPSSRRKLIGFFCRTLSIPDRLAAAKIAAFA